MKGLDDVSTDISLNSDTGDMSISVPLYLDNGKLRANQIRIADYREMSWAESTVIYFSGDEAIREIGGI